jgi:hypothetical protein
MTDPRPIGYWLKLVDRLIDELFASTLEEHGVTRRQWQLLAVLSRGAATAAELSAAVAPFLARADDDSHDDSDSDRENDGDSVAEHLSELVESGWVAHSETGYQITERGTVAYTRLAEVVAVNRDAATRGVSAEDYATTVATLERVAGNLGWSDGPADAG